MQIANALTLPGITELLSRQNMQHDYFEKWQIDVTLVLDAALNFNDIFALISSQRSFSLDCDVGQSSFADTSSCTSNSALPSRELGCIVEDPGMDGRGRLSIQ